MPILGISASGISGHLTPPWSPEGAYDALATVSLSAAAASVTLSGIPTGYKHLQIRVIARTNRVEVSGDYLKITFNSDTGANYSDHYLRGDGSGTSASGNVNNSAMFASRFSCSSQASGIFGALVLDVLDYGDTNKYKTIKSLGGYDANGSGTISFQSGNWRNMSAVTAITFVPGGGTSFETYSHFALYGVK